jgi:putative transposase
VGQIDWDSPELTIKTQATLLGLNRTSLYYQPVPVSAEELAIKRRIDEIYTAWPFYGSPRITAQLKRDGWKVNHKRIERYLHQMGLAAICPGPNLSKRQAAEGVWPYLLRGVQIVRPKQVFGIDITYVRLRHSWMYLVAVLDWYSRYVVAWELDETLEMPFVLCAVDRALACATPDIVNSDQGSHFTSPHYTSRVLAAGAHISMDGRGRVFDNIFTERLWRTVKYEEVYLHDYESPRQARGSLTHYFDFYNYQRLHQALDYRTPAEVYFG